MVRVFVISMSGKLHSCQISLDTDKCLRDGALLRNQSRGFILRRVIATYGELTEYNIQRFMREIWRL